MIWLLIFFFLLFVIGLAKDWGGVLFFIAIILVICGLSTFSTYIDHAHDLGTIRNANIIIEVQEQRIESLKKSINEFVPLGKNPGTLFNADSPIKSMIDNMAEAERKLAETKREVVEAKVDISRREAGPFWFIVSMFGKE